MKRLARWPFNLASAFSLLLCVMLVIAFVRGHFVADYLMKKHYSLESHTNTITHFALINGRLVFDREIWIYPPPYYPDGAVWDDSTTYQRQSAQRVQRAPAANWWFHVEHTYGPAPNGIRIDERIFVISSLLILPAATILPVLWARRHFRDRQKPGHCRHCGYDLRATPNRCPECGMIPARIES